MLELGTAALLISNANKSAYNIKINLSLDKEVLSLILKAYQRVARCDQKEFYSCKN